MSLLWSIDELGEVIAILKKKGAAAVMDNESVRAHFTEEIADVFMYLFDMMECYGITAEEFTEAFLAKFQRNLGRDWRENDALYEKSGLANPGVIVDTNHANSGKKPLEQPRIIFDVLHSARYNEGIRKMLKGFMVESYIEDGAQKIGEGIYGKSITDPCIGWEKTERLILDIADKL